ncbi:MAG: pilus assembly protein [Micrococcales bacterium]|nr:pilus assembly protein [Micrococcales bacterium]MCL2668312.1 pilus assembly protein [Micrococcales bacterium]
MTTTATRTDAGHLSLGVAITIPAVFFFLVLLIMAGRLATANGAVQAAAAEAARAASISRTAPTAQAAAEAAATTTLGSSDLECATSSVVADLSGFSAPLGQDAQVTVTVTCTVPLSELTVLGQGDRTITATATSVLDPYRSRQ